jgi:ribose transport system substrate-binding protein
MSRKARAGQLVLGVVLTGAITAGACGGSDKGSGSSSASSKYLDVAQKQLAASYAGTNGKPPGSGPSAQKGKSVWIVSCGQSLEGCANATKAEQAAAGEIGWKTNVFDGKLDPATFNTGVRQALAAKADGVILNAIDCPLVKAALQQARKAKVPVVGLYSLDCSEAGPGQPSLLTSVYYGPAGPDYSRYVSAWAAPRADWLISKTAGRAKVIDFVQTDLPTPQLVDKAFNAELRKCPGCKVVDRVTFASADIGPPLQQKAQQAIVKNPGANAIHVPYDGAIVAGIGPAIAASGQGGRLAVVGGEGNGTNLKLIAADRGQDAANVVDVGWLGWGAVDTLNRAFAGKPAAPEGIGWQIADRQHNLSANGAYNVGVDFKSGYRKVWGLSK